MKIDSVYGASRYTQKVTEAPSSITIVTTDDIERFGHRTLEDVLRSVRGFYVTNDRNYSYLGVRGFSRPGDYNARILLLVDGHRLNDNVFGSALLGTEFPLDVDLIERIEIIRGPSSSLYGTSAFFAVINVITKRGGVDGGDGGWRLARHLRSRKGRVSFGRELARREVFLSGSAYESEGQHHLFFQEFDSPRPTSASPRTPTRTAMSSSSAVKFEELHARRAVRRQGQDGPYRVVRHRLQRSRIANRRDPGVRRPGRTSARWPAAGTLRARVSRSLPLRRRLHLRARRWRCAGLGAEQGLRPRQPVGRRGEADEKLVADTPWRWARSSATTSGRTRTTTTKRLPRIPRRSPELDELGALRPGRDEAARAAAREPRPPPRSVRHVRRHDQSARRADLPPVRRTTVKLLYGQAFRAPNAYELFWRQDDVAKPNPVLRPETNSTSEFVLEQSLSSAVRVGVTAFHYRVDDLISQQTDPFDDLLVYNNVDRIDASGLELEVEGKWSSGFGRASGYTYQNSRNQDTTSR